VVGEAAEHKEEGTDNTQEDALIVIGDPKLLEH